MRNKARLVVGLREETNALLEDKALRFFVEEQTKTNFISRTALMDYCMRVVLYCAKNNIALPPYEKIQGEK